MHLLDITTRKSDRITVFIFKSYRIRIWLNNRFARSYMYGIILGNNKVALRSTCRESQNNPQHTYSPEYLHNILPLIYTL